VTNSPETPVEAPAVAAKHAGRLVPPARYRHPGDAIRLILAGLVLAAALAVGVAAHATYAGARAAALTGVAPSTVPGRVLAGLMQVLFAAAAVAAIAVMLRCRRFRPLASLAGGAVLASAVLIGIFYLAGGVRARALAAGADRWSWLTGVSLAGPAVFAAAVAGTLAAAPWLSRRWRRTAWIALWLAAVVRLVTGTASPVEGVVAFATGVTVGAGVLALLGASDRRIGPGGIAAALALAGLPVACVGPPAVEAKGSRPSDGSALLVMDRVNGSSLDRVPVQDISDTMLRELWKHVDRLHRAKNAHRSLGAANIVVDGPCRPWIVDFSFSEPDATRRQMALDVAELLASLSTLIGAGKAVRGAAAVIGPDGVAAAVPLLQPHRLATYWLPVAPGWLSWRVLQRREYV